MACRPNHRGVAIDREGRGDVGVTVAFDVVHESAETLLPLVGRRRVLGGVVDVRVDAGAGRATRSQPGRGIGRGVRGCLWSRRTVKLSTSDCIGPQRRRSA